MFRQGLVVLGAPFPIDMPLPSISIIILFLVEMYKEFCIGWDFR